LRAAQSWPIYQTQLPAPRANGAPDKAGSGLIAEVAAAGTLVTRRELRQFGVHAARRKLVDFADCRVFKLLTSQGDRLGMATH